MYISSTSSYLSTLPSLQTQQSTRSTSELEQLQQTSSSGTDALDLATALFESDSSASSNSVSDLYALLDSNADDAITPEEFSAELSALLEEATSGLLGAHGMGGPHGPPPPPPEDEGMTEDEMTSALEAATESGDTRLASLLASTLEQFDAADTDGDGKVSFVEAKAIEGEAETPATTPAETRNLAQLLAAYGLGQTELGSSSSFMV